MADYNEPWTGDESLREAGSAASGSGTEPGERRSARAAWTPGRPSLFAGSAEPALSNSARGAAALSPCASRARGPSSVCDATRAPVPAAPALRNSRTASSFEADGDAAIDELHDRAAQAAPFARARSSTAAEYVPCIGIARIELQRLIGVFLDEVAMYSTFVARGFTSETSRPLADGPRLSCALGVASGSRARRHAFAYASRLFRPALAAAPRTACRSSRARTDARCESGVPASVRAELLGFEVRLERRAAVSSCASKRGHPCASSVGTSALANAARGGDGENG